jgi:hypothetical protein
VGIIFDFQEIILKNANNFSHWWEKPDAIVKDQKSCLFFFIGCPSKK